MIYIIAGSRNFKDKETFFFSMLDHRATVSKVVSGCALGPDTWGEEWAEMEGIEVIRMPANWTDHGKSAGPIRNAEMADIADVLIAFWDGESRGTADMIKKALNKGLEVHVYRDSK